MAGENRGALIQMKRRIDTIREEPWMIVKPNFGQEVRLIAYSPKTSGKWMKVTIYDISECA
jgi:hypothetical protein